MKSKGRRPRHLISGQLVFAYIALVSTLIGIVLGAFGVFSFKKFLQPKQKQENKQELAKPSVPKVLTLEFANGVDFTFPDKVYVPGILREAYQVDGEIKDLSMVWEQVYNEIKSLGCSKKGKSKFWTESKNLGRVYVIFSDGVYIVWLVAFDKLDSAKKRIEDFSFKSLNKVAKIKCKEALEPSRNAEVKFLVCTRSTKNGTKWENDAKYKICVIKNTSGQEYLISWKIFAKEKERVGCKFK